jgi:NitT/TauT family transport system permease protein
MKVFMPNHKWVGGLAVLCVFLVWQISAGLIQLPLILPTPKQAFAQVLTLLVTKDFWHHLGATLGRGMIGFGLSLSVGMIIGILAGQNTTVNAFFRPIIILMRSTPVMSVIILALIWFKRETVPVFATFLMVFPIMVQNIIEGIRSVDRDLLEMVEVFRVTGWLRFTRLYVPSLLPFLAAGISVGLGITWKVLIAAEVLSYPRWGIGTQMDTARVYLQTDKLFAWTLVVVAMGLLFDYILDYLLKKPFKARKEAVHD